MKKLAIILVNLKFEKYNATNFRQQEHIGLGYIGAVAKKNGYPINIINAQFNNIENNEHIIPIIMLGKSIGLLKTPMEKPTARASILVAKAKIINLKPFDGSFNTISSSFFEKDSLIIFIPMKERRTKAIQ